MEIELTFDDVLIKPRFSMIESRKDVNISTNVGRLPYMALPILSSNMSSVTEVKMALAMLHNGGQAALHRFCSIEDNVKMLIDSRVGGTGGYDLPFVSIGLDNKELERAEALVNAGAYCVIIDVANGASMAVVKQSIELRKLFPDLRIVVGNFATGESVKTFLYHNSSIDGVKAGIGSGSACTTRIKTGIGIPQLSCILDIDSALWEYRQKIALIADGGMRTAGDICKAIGAGADMCMLGGMLAGTEESPGIEQWDSKKYSTFAEARNNGHVYKKYRGSASKESYAAQGKDETWITAEGDSFMVPFKGPVKDILQDIAGGLRSSLSYVGAKNLREFKERVRFIRITSAGVIENGAHGKHV